MVWEMKHNFAEKSSDGYDIVNLKDNKSII